MRRGATLCVSVDNPISPQHVVVGVIQCHWISLCGCGKLFGIDTFHVLVTEAPPPLAVALHRALAERGMTGADFIRELGWTEATVRQAIEGKTATPNKRLRDRLDEYFGAPTGHTLRICIGEVAPYYPNPDRLARFAQALAGVDAAVVDRVLELVYELAGMKRHP